MSFREISAEEVFKRLDSKRATYFPYEVLLAVFNIHEYESVRKVEDRLMAYHITRWQSTDEWVGLTAITFDGRPFALAYRSGRKSDYDIQFVSQELTDELYAAAVPACPAVPLLDMNSQFPGFFKVEMGGDIIDDQAYYKGKPVTITQKFTAMGDYRNWRKLIVRDNTGKEQLITTDNLMIPFCIDWDKKLD